MTRLLGILVGIGLALGGWGSGSPWRVEPVAGGIVHAPAAPLPPPAAVAMHPRVPRSPVVKPALIPGPPVAPVSDYPTVPVTALRGAAAPATPAPQPVTEPHWEPLGAPFRRRASARGLAQRLESLTGTPIRVEGRAGAWNLQYACLGEPACAQRRRTLLARMGMR